MGEGVWSLGNVKGHQFYLIAPLSDLFTVIRSKVCNESEKITIGRQKKSKIKKYIISAEAEKRLESKKKKKAEKLSRTEHGNKSRNNKKE